MQYTQKSFTLPAGGSQISQKQWDFATLSPEEFKAKYPTIHPNGQFKSEITFLASQTAAADLEAQGAD